MSRVDLGDDDAGALDGVVEVAGEGDRLLAGHRVDDDQHLGRVDLVGEVRQLVGELVVEGDSAAGVDDDGGRATALRLGERALADLRGRGLGVLGVDGTPIWSPRTRSCSEAAARWKSVATSSGLQAVLLEVQREPGGERGLARALHAADQDPGRPALCAQQRLVAASEDLDQLVVDGADYLLAGRDRLQQLGAGGAFTDARDEVAHDAKVDVRLEQRDAHLAQRRIEVVLGNPPAATEAAKRGLQPLAQCFQHRWECSSGVDEEACGGCCNT